jgi:hypothetical protein
MTLETLLREAAPEATFDPEDVQHRVRRSRARRRGLLGGLALVLLLAGGLAALALLRQDEPSSVVTGPPDDSASVSFTSGALEGTRWVQVAPDSTAPAWVEFDVADQARVGDGCRVVDGTWIVAGGRLRLVVPNDSTDELPQPRDPDAPPLCPVEPTQLTRDPALHADGRLVLGGLELRRVDTLGEPGARDDLLGQWQTPDGELDVGFDTTIHVNSCEFAFVFDDERGRMDSYNPACDFIGPAATVSHAVLRGRPIVDDDELWMVSPDAVARLVRTGRAPSPTVVLSDGPWVPEDPADFVDLPRIVFTTGGSFRAFGSCASWTGTWEAVDGRPVVDVTSSTVGFCTQEDEAGDVYVAGLAGGGPVDIDGDVMNVGPYRFRQLGGEAAVTVPENLVGRWTAADGHVVQFSEDTLSVDDTCATVGWDLSASTLRYRPVSTCRIGVDPRSSEWLGLDSSVVVRLVGDDLYLIREADQVAVYHRAPSEEGGEQLLYEAISALRVDPRWEAAPEGGFDLVGFGWGDDLVDVGAFPVGADIVVTPDLHLATCSGYHVLIDGPPDAANALFDVLGCEAD